MFEYKHYEESANFIKEKLQGFTPEFLLVLGSGLGFLGDQVENSIAIDYYDIPHFKASTAPDHKGRFVFGILGNKPVVVMQGRLHFYEGYNAEEITYPIRVAKLLGVTSMIVTNAAGGVNTTYQPGQMMLIEDVIKFSEPNPLLGPNIKEFGTRFNDMTYTYTKEYRDLAKTIAKEQELILNEGVYFYAQGPQFETPAEIRAMRILGADAVGMSTVPESIVARHAGMKILGISLITNMAAGMLAQEITAEEVNETAGRSKEMFSTLIIQFLERV